MSKMFDLVTETYNPLGGRCPHDCIYCWSMGEKGLVKKWDMKKYQGEIRLIEKEFKRKFEDGSFVFVQDMSDLFADAVPYRYIAKILSYIEDFPKATFLLLTKNPERYLDLYIPKNCICGATIETNRWYPISYAPEPSSRIVAMTQLKHRKMVSIEPIMNFDIEVFVLCLQAIAVPAHLKRLEFIYIGYDNYGYHLSEPPLSKTEQLISELSKFTVVYQKTIRKAWDEQTRGKYS